MLGSHFGKQRETELPQSLGRRQHSAPEQKMGLSAWIYVTFPDPGPGDTSHPCCPESHKSLAYLKLAPLT